MSIRSRSQYEHTQRGYWHILVVLVIVIVMFATRRTRPPPPWVLGIGLGLPLIAGWLFSSMTIRIDSAEISWRFGPGIVRKRAVLTDVAALKAVRTTFFDGWGMKRRRGGWLYNVSGFDAVQLSMNDGKLITLGTDEPRRLLSALRSATHLQ
jgi:hypothetical protein